MAKKNNQHKTNAVRLVEHHEISYELFHFPWKEDEFDAREVGPSLDRLVDQIFKTLVALGDKTGPLVAVIPSNKALDLKKMASASYNKRVEMLPMRDLEKTTGYMRGGCSPIGMKKRYPTYVAAEALAFETILVSAGRRGMQIGLPVEALLEITAGTIADISSDLSF